MQDTHRLKAPLLCCICHDQNTSLRYEVVYRQADRSITILDVSASKEELEAHGLTRHIPRRTVELEGRGGVESQISK